MAAQSQPGRHRPNRGIVTEDALVVSREMLGRPLARPWRRAAAISVDGLLVSILANASGVLFGFAAAYVLFRVSGRQRAGAGYIRRSFRFMFRLGGAMVLFGVAVSLWGTVGERIRGSVREEGGGEARASVALQAVGNAGSALTFTGFEAVGFASEVGDLHRAQTSAEAGVAAERILNRMRSAGVRSADAGTAVRHLAGEVAGKPWMVPVVDSVIQAHATADEASVPVPAADSSAVLVSADSLVLAYAAALAAEDSAAVDSLRPSVVALVAADTVGVLAGSIASLNREREELRSEVTELRREVERGPGVLATIRALAEDLGLGLGWFGLYFTATTALWQGRTVGKRLLGIRVISLTGKPIGWWAAFERFGGYAAGFATGLLGFLQILWDDNRQAIHDKIAATAVVRD